LNICSIDVPPLRERREDIGCLAESFLKNYCRKYGMDKELAPGAAEKLESYHWPGNVRELENAIHRLYISERGRIIEADTVDQLLYESVSEGMIVNLKREIGRSEDVDFNQIMEEQEKRLIAYALKKEGTTRKAAEYLNLPQATLARKKVRYGL
jgi:transcriptional regulator with PAS, ATPase and Fis domain